MSQDGRHRENNTWLWAKYDGHGRAVMNGTLTSSLTRSQIQNHFDTYSAAEHFEEPFLSSGNLLKYTNRSFPLALPITESNVKSVNYYDDYGWVDDVSLTFQYYQNLRWNYSNGLATGSLVRRMDTGTWMKTVLYYDDQNRVIQSQTKNRYGSVNRTDAVIDFEGKVSENRTIYRRPSHSDLTVSTHYTYDNAGRPLTAVHKINGTETPLAGYEYDEIGRMTRTSPGSPVPLQTNDYSYTLQGQLRGINLNTAGNINLSGNDLFALKLDRHETGSTYNGKLNKQTWQTRTTPGAGSTPRSFTYGYDGFDRINSSGFSGVGSEDYGMPGIDYDANGNLTAFNRKGLASPGNWQSIDILEFSYTSTIGNKLQYIREWGNNSVGFTEIDFNNTNDYTYYPDGSLKSDANKGISLIEYNYLGLVEKVHFGSSKRIENIYDAGGVKLEQKLINGGTTHTAEYMGDLIYKNGVLETILHDEGRVKVEGSNRRYQFFITDHLGSTRAIIERISGTTTLVQENHFGVWGETLAGLSTTGDWKFLFQGKEYIDFEGYNVYDFHTRGYDPWAGRFWQVDGADQFASGYVGMGNQPTIGVDPDEQFVEFIIGAAIGGFSGWRIGKAQGATGWGMAGYIAAGAGIGALTAGIGNYIGGLTASWGAFGSGMASGAVAGFVGGGLNSTLAGSNFWQGAGRGALWGGAIGGTGSYLNDVYTDWRIQREMFSPEYGLAQNGPGPKYFGKHLDEVIITAKRNSQIELSLTGRALGKAIGAFAANMGTVVESWPPYSYTGAITPSYPEAMLMPIPKIGFAAKTGTQGFKSLGAAGKGYNEVLQSGGQSLKPNTLKALNLTKEQGRNAIHGLKSELGLPNNFHGRIMGNGDYLHPSTGKWLGNLFDYMY